MVVDALLINIINGPFIKRATVNIVIFRRKKSGSRMKYLIRTNVNEHVTLMLLFLWHGISP